MVPVFSFAFTNKDLDAKRKRGKSRKSENWKACCEREMLKQRTLPQIWMKKTDWYFRKKKGIKKEDFRGKTHESLMRMGAKRFRRRSNMFIAHSQCKNNTLGKKKFRRLILFTLFKPGSVWMILKWKNLGINEGGNMVSVELLPSIFRNLKSTLVI